MSDNHKVGGIAGLILALQLLTTIPIRRQVPWTKQTASVSVALYPLIGLIVGSIAMSASILMIEWMLLPTAVSSFLLLLLIVSLTGGLHLDGWMDVSDGYFSRQDQDRKLTIMKDSRVGAFAVISLFFLLAGKYIFIFQVLESAEAYWFYFLIIPFFARWLMAGALMYGKPAREEGMAYSVQQCIIPRTKVSFHLWGIFILIGIAIFFSKFIILALLLTMTSVILLLCSFTFFRKQFGGITGDTLGALVEGGEAVLWIVAWLLLYYGMA
ncbi:adenosylcobinamide-GDP ribazoletransferase [Alkalihalobacillus sp. BA299]|uniref:adenosylcobinamide-GDP ribazoletransferase n=1 Tax=Alkalihalobacillus sp. BA299 TaxID=2815938 RepID=UPI001ADA8391|nr:adenosylcobinamide-GDP ribazoletransferase [Alkalihalobacillus sp. BA299]